MITAEKIRDQAQVLGALTTDFKYCVYLTMYYGDKLPEFYIGHTTTKKVHNGYHGSVTSKKYKTLWDLENRENPGLFITEILSRHDTRQEAAAREQHVQKLFEVVPSEQFTNMAYASKMFFHDQRHTAETKAKIGAKSKLRKHTEETKLRMAKSQKGLPRRKATEETKLKMSLTRRGKKQTPELIAKRVLGMIGKKRVPLSEEAKALLSLKNRGRVFDGQFKASVAAGLRASRGYDYVLSNGDDLIITESLADFCEEHNLPYSSLIACFKAQKIHRKSGWHVTRQDI